MKKDLKLKEGRILDGRFNEGLLEETWFHGEISCDEAKARLSLNDQVGSYLVRNVGSLYILSFVGKIKHKIKHLTVPYSRAHGLLKENPGLKTEYEVVRYILSLGCKWFLHPVHRSKIIQPSDLENVKIEREDKKSLRCKLCENLSKSISDAYVHDANHRLSFCQRCKDLVLATSQVNHKRMCNPDFILKCKICSKYETKCPKALRRHTNTCQTNLKCSPCDKSFMTEKKLQRHECLVHKKRVSCDLCGMKLSLKSVLMHKRNVHKLDIVRSKNESRYQCPKCDFKTPYKQLLGKHLNTHKHKYQCNDCSFSTNKQLHIEKHNALFHKYLIPIKEKTREKMIIIGF